MTGTRRRPLELTPLLQTYLDAGLAPGAELGQLPVIGSRFQAILTAGTTFLNDAFLDSARDSDFAEVLTQFYESCVFPPLQGRVLRERAGFLRHALAHLLRCPDPLAIKAERFLAPQGCYHVAGLGPAFWSALFQALDPALHPMCQRGILRGLERLGLWQTGATGAGSLYGQLLRIYDELLGQYPYLAALHLDHFLLLVAGMQGRDLWTGVDHLRHTLIGCDLESLIRSSRAALPLRRRLKERGRTLAKARADVEVSLTARDPLGIMAALTAAASEQAERSRFDLAGHGETLLHWTRQLWLAEDPAQTLAAFWAVEPLPGAGLWLPTTLLYLRNPKHFFPWDSVCRQGHALLSDGHLDALPLGQQYALYLSAMSSLRERASLHPLEIPAVLAAVAEDQAEQQREVEPPGFIGFATDTFTFLRQLRHNNRRDWMQQQHGRYQFILRQPLVELCQELTRRYVAPVLNGSRQLDLETSPRIGKVLSSICKNDYGRSQPYQTSLWLTFCRRSQGGKKKDVQFFVHVTEQGVGFGLRLGREVREASKLFRRHVQEHAELLYQALCRSGAAAHCRFARGDNWSDTVAIHGAGDLRTWAAGKTLMAGAFLPADAPLLRQEDLVGEIILTFDRLLPAYLCAVLPDPVPELRQRLANTAAHSVFTASEFARHTGLGPQWLGRARSLLALKRQLILQGVPGTGKTHVARCLARWITANREEAIRLVQFHPAYSYEEFVEGIKVRSVESQGRHDVTYPVEAGLLCAFAERASQTPTQPFVLIIDEINRGNLPRIFGELLYLLEYREQGVVLPYSRQLFRLPGNLFILGTMNAADRSAALIDQALRRRFSFLDMPPDSAILSDWFQKQPPRGGAAFAELVVHLFERLNSSLHKDLGPHCQVGHSYFMVPDLDADTLQTIWEHQVHPLLRDYFAGQPGRAEAYELERLLQAEWRGSGRHPSAALSAEISARNVVP